MMKTIFLTLACFTLFLNFISAADNTTAECARAITQCRDGISLPVWTTPGNNDGTAWIAARAFVYLVVMFYFFLGISIISDRFMASIEIITSQEKEITIKDKVTGKKTSCDCQDLERDRLQFDSYGLRKFRPRNLTLSY